MGRPKKTVYNIRKGAKISHTRAQGYGEELEKIKDKHSKLTPQIIVEEASKHTSKLHKYFEWDDSVAGEKFRIHQARLLMCAIEETVVVNGKANKMRSFFNVVNEEKESVYVSIKEVSQNKIYKAQLIDDIVDKMESTTVLLKKLKKV